MLRRLQVQLQALWRLRPARTVFHACQGQAVNELVVSAFDTDPPVLRIERGDRVAVYLDKRAEAVVAALKEAGVDTGQMAAMGYGEEKPIADNGDEEGRETNRRIEITLIAGSADAAAAAPVPRLADGSPDFASDTSPSVAPAENTLRPKARPANNE